MMHNNTADKKDDGDQISLSQGLVEMLEAILAIPDGDILVVSPGFNGFATEELDKVAAKILLSAFNDKQLSKYNLSQLLTIFSHAIYWLETVVRVKRVDPKDIVHKKLDQKEQVKPKPLTGDKVDLSKYLSDISDNQKPN